MTGWTLSVGYNSGSAGPHDLTENEAELRKVVLALRHDPERLVQAAIEYGACLAYQGEVLQTYAEQYHPNITADQGSPLTQDRDPGGDYYVLITASGGEPERTMKEHIARAFCRCVLLDMHCAGIDINLTVT